MGYQINLGTLSGRAGRVVSTTRFRIAVLGDFSGRANRGLIDVGDALAARKPIKLDIDTIDSVIERFGSKLALPLGEDGSVVEFEPRSLEDLHPDQLYRELDFFGHLAALRKRLQTASTFAAAAKEVRGWSPDLAPAHKVRRRSRSNAVRVDAKLSDFRKLIGAPAAATGATVASVDDLVRRMVGPHVTASANPDQKRLVAAVDAALSGAMRSVLHHPDFQALESAWRSLDLLVRRVETDAKLQIVLFDISADEFAADLSATGDLAQTGLYRLLVEQPAADAQQGPFSLVLGNYMFELTPPHAELLGRMARIAQQSGATFVAGVGNECIDTRQEDLNPLVADAWAALRALPVARHLALALPRFLLRTPYGAKTDPVDAFDFEEFDPQTGLRGMLWGNPAMLAGILLAEQYRRSGIKLELGKMLSIGELPYFFYTDADGEQVALPCTERLLTERKTIHVNGYGFIPVLALKGRPEVRLAGLAALGGGPIVGPWTPEGERPGPCDDSGETGEAGESPAVPEAEAESSGSDAATDAEATEDAADAVAESGGEGAAAEQSSDSSAASDDLDALLAQLGASDTEPEAAKPEEDAVDDELAKLLKELG